MIVGFTITDFNGHEAEAIEFIRKVCVLENPEVAKNIVAAGVGVSVYSPNLTRELLNSQPFSCTPIETQAGRFLLVSNVDFLLEFSYADNVVRLEPTHYIYIPVSQAKTKNIAELHKKNLIVLIPDPTDGTANRILETGSWNDNGIWIDSLEWEGQL